MRNFFRVIQWTNQVDDKLDAMKKNTVTPFVLKSVEMKGFRLFSRLTGQLHPKLTVLVAPNSGGKTAFLDGVAHILKSFLTGYVGKLSKFDKYRNTAINGAESVDLSLLGRIDLLKDYFSLSLENEPVSDLTIKIQSGHTSQYFEPWSSTNDGLYGLFATGPAISLSKMFQTQTNSAYNLKLPLLAYFTANRRVVSLKDIDSFDHDFELSKDQAFLALLPCEGLTNFDEWLRERAINALEKRLEFEETGNTSVPEPDDHLKAVSVVLAKMLSEVVDIKDVKYFSSSKSIQAVRSNGDRLDISQLSHGAKSILTIAAEIAMHCCALNPRLKQHAPIKTPGIILIDEIDLHLHPKWQQHVLGDLQECFPCMQFIVSTHSPAILTTVRKENIREINVDPETGEATVLEPLNRSYGESSGDLQETIMGVPARPNNPSVQALKKYLNWAENGDLDENKSSERADLETEWGIEHMDLLTADMIIKRRNLLSEKK